MTHDQIHSPAFQKISDYIWSPNLGDAYVQSVIQEHNPKLIPCNKKSPPSNGVIFVGMTQIIEDVYAELPKTGSFIIIHRPSDRSYTDSIDDKKPASVKFVYSVDCAVRRENVMAIPFGTNSINGDDLWLRNIHAETVPKATTRVFCRYNVNNSGYTKERIASLPILKSKPFVKVVESQIPADEFFRELSAHQFTMSLQGCGKDCARTYSSMTLGSIPIVTDCVEMRHFEDMPMSFCPPWESFTEEWLDQQAELMKGKSTERAHMSYWVNHIKMIREKCGI
jgi:hypothetical protein